MVGDAVPACFVGLVDVDALDGAAELSGGCVFVLRFTADRMVEDEDFGCTCADRNVSIFR